MVAQETFKRNVSQVPMVSMKGRASVEDQPEPSSQPITPPPIEITAAEEPEVRFQIGGEESPVVEKRQFPKDNANADHLRPHKP